MTTPRQTFLDRFSALDDADEALWAVLERVFPVQTDLPQALAQLTVLRDCWAGFDLQGTPQLEGLQEAWDTQYTYESNRIEGNTLTLRETSMVIHEGISVGGKSVREHLEALNHRDAIVLMRSTAQGTEPIHARVLLRLHSLILRTIDSTNAGAYRNVRVMVRGSQRVFPNPAKVPDLVAGVFDSFATQLDVTHPVELAAWLHHRLVYVHPFVDGNGRTARLMQNLVLLRYGYPIANIKGDNEQRRAYYDAIQKADEGDYADFYALVYRVARQALLDCLAMVCLNTDNNDTGARFYGLMAEVA